MECSKQLRINKLLNINNKLQIVMTTYEKQRLEQLTGELILNATVKLEENSWPKNLDAADLGLQEYPAEMKAAQSIETEMELETTEAAGAHDFTSEPQTANNALEDIKTEFISDDEHLDEVKTDLAAHFKVIPDQAGDSMPDNASETCVVCYNTFSKELIRRHMSLGLCKTLFKCEFCSRTFDYRAVLKQHLMTHSKDRKREFACDLCEKRFYTKRNLVQHMSCHAGITYDCQMCGARFTEKDALKSHMAMKLLGKARQFRPNEACAAPKIKLMSAGQNSSVTAANIQVNQQQDVPLADKQRSKVLIGAKHATSELISRHMRRAHNTRIFKCDICQRRCANAGTLKTHMRTHAENRKRDFACHICGSTFFTKSNLDYHMKGHSDDTYHCKLCLRSFKHKSSLTRHLALHSSNRTEFSCHSCERKFSTNEGLKVHLLRKHGGKASESTSEPQAPNEVSVHIKEELISDQEFIDEEIGSDSAQGNQQSAGASPTEDSVSCEVCNNVYARELIKVHMRLAHPLPLQCNLCQRHCKNKQSLQLHMSTHADRKREFACQSCDKTFFTKANLDKHMELHSGNTYECELCSRSFKHKTYLQRHLITHSKGRRREYPCDLCECAFYTRRDLNMHVLRKHPEKRHVLRRRTAKTAPSTPNPQTPSDASVQLKKEFISDEEFTVEKDGEIHTEEENLQEYASITP